MLTAQGWATMRARWVPCAAPRCSSWSVGVDSRHHQFYPGHVYPVSVPFHRPVPVHHHQDQGYPNLSPYTYPSTLRITYTKGKARAYTLPNIITNHNFMLRLGRARVYRKVWVIRINRILIEQDRGVIETLPSSNKLLPAFKSRLFGNNIRNLGS